MTNEETFQKLGDMRLHAFTRALREQLDHADSFAHLGLDRVGILIYREWTEREARSLTRRLQLARLRDRAAAVEDIDFGHPRGLDRNLVRRLSSCEWIQKKQNLVITGIDRLRQDLRSLRLRTEGVSRRLLGALPARPPPAQ